MGSNCHLQNTVINENDCKEASLQLGHVYQGKLTSSWYPAGCLWMDSYDASYFNTIVDPSNTLPTNDKGRGAICSKGISFIFIELHGFLIKIF